MTQANPSHPYTLASRSKSLPASQNLPKSMVAQTHGRKESTGIQHCIKAIAGEVVKLSSVHLINFGGGGQVIALKSATALILDRCGEIRSAPFATTVRRITSASCARRFADFAQQADLLNPKNGSKLPSRDFANPPNR